MARLSSFRGIIWLPCLFALACVTAVSPSSRPEHGRENVSVENRASRAVAPGILLRILPLGDSITFGYLSTDGNGYRLDLLNDLTNSGSQVLYIGSQQSGSMANNQNEGFPGYTINQIAAATRDVLFQEPNVVLLHAGTNDMNDDPPKDPYASAPNRLGSLIDEILCICPNSTIIVAQIIESSNPGTSERIATFNAEIPNIVDARLARGFKVMTVNMSSIGPNPSELTDGLHPDDQGYDAMAAFWFSALQEASSQGWITTPDPPESIPPNSTTTGAASGSSAPASTAPASTTSAGSASASATACVPSAPGPIASNSSAIASATALARSAVSSAVSVAFSLASSIASHNVTSTATGTTAVLGSGSGSATATGSSGSSASTDGAVNMVAQGGVGMLAGALGALLAL